MFRGYDMLWPIFWGSKTFMFHGFRVQRYLLTGMILQVNDSSKCTTSVQTESKKSASWDTTSKVLRCDNGMMNFGRLLDDTIFVDKFPSYTHQPTMVFPRVCWGYTPQKFNIAPENWWPRKTIRLSYWVSVTFQGRTVKLRGGYLKHP